LSHYRTWLYAHHTGRHVSGRIVNGLGKVCRLGSQTTKTDSGHLPVHKRLTAYSHSTKSCQSVCKSEKGRGFQESLSPASRIATGACAGLRCPVPPGLPQPEDRLLRNGPSRRATPVILCDPSRIDSAPPGVWGGLCKLSQEQGQNKSPVWFA